MSTTCTRHGCGEVVYNEHHCSAGHIQDRTREPMVGLSRAGLKETILEHLRTWTEGERMLFLAELLQSEAEYGIHSDELRGTLTDAMHRIRMEKL